MRHVRVSSHRAGHRRSATRDSPRSTTHTARPDRSPDVSMMCKHQRSLTQAPHPEITEYVAQQRESRQGRRATSTPGFAIHRYRSRPQDDPVREPTCEHSPRGLPAANCLAPRPRDSGAVLTVAGRGCSRNTFLLSRLRATTVGATWQVAERTSTEGSARALPRSCLPGDRYQDDLIWIRPVLPGTGAAPGATGSTEAGVVIDGFWWGH